MDRAESFPRWCLQAEEQRLQSARHTSPGLLMFTTKRCLRTGLRWMCLSLRFPFLYPNADIRLHYRAPCRRGSAVRKSLYRDQNSLSPACHLD